MGTRRSEQIFCDAEYFDNADANHIKDIAVQAALNLGTDAIGGGTLTSSIVQTSPLSLSVTISSFEGYSTLGEHLEIGASQDIDLTDNVPDSGYMYVSIFAKFLWTESDERADGIGDVVPHQRIEDVEFTVVEGTANVPPVNPGSGSIRVCTIRLHSTTTQITNAMILKTGSYADWLIPLSGRVKKTGDVLSGTLYYGTHPLLYANKGKHSIGTAYSPNTTDPDWQNHYIASTSLINTGITGKSLQVSIAPKINFYLGGTSAVAPYWITPITMRMHTDFMAAMPAPDKLTFSEGIYVYQEVDANDDFTGNICIFVVGTQHFVNRFTGQQIRWCAFAPMAAGII